MRKLNNSTCYQSETAVNFDNTYVEVFAIFFFLI